MPLSDFEYFRQFPPGDCDDCPNNIRLKARRFRTWLTVMITAMAFGLAFSAWRIYRTGQFLDTFSHYTHARDARWEPIMIRIQKLLDRLDEAEKARQQRRGITAEVEW